MAYGFDASSILSSYMEGANFVARGMERAEEARKQRERDEANAMVGQAIEVVAPKYDAQGHVVPQTADAVAQSDQFKNLANTPGMQSVLMQGVNDPRVKAVKYVGAVKGSTPNTFVPVLQHLGEDGQVISEGPLTEDRSSNPNAPVKELSVNDVFNHAASVVYSKSPELGHRMFELAKRNALGAIQEQFRNSSPEERQGIVKVALEHGYNIEDLTHKSGAKERKVDLERGGWWEHDPIAGTTVFVEDPTVKHTGDAVDQVQTERGLKKNAQKRAQDLTIDVQQAPTRRSLRADEIKSDTNATSQARFENAPTDAQTHKVLDQAKYDQTREQNATMNRTLRDVWTVLTNPASSADEIAAAQSKADEYQKDPVSGETARKTFSAMRSLEPKSFGGLLAANPKAAAQAIIDGAPYRTAKELDGLYTDVRSRAENGDANAREVLPTLIRAMDGLNADKGKGVEPGKFQSPMAKEYYKSVSGNKSSDADVQAMEAGAQRAFNRLRDVLPPNEIAAGSKGETYASVAAAKAHYLEQNGMSNAEKPMYIHTELQDLGYPVDRLGSPKEFVTEIYNPLGDALKKAGVAEMDDATVRRIGSELAVGLWQKGINKGVAINEVVKLFKEPRTYANKLHAAGGNLRSLAEGLAKEIEKRPSALGQAIDKAGPLIDSMSME